MFRGAEKHPGNVGQHRCDSPGHKSKMNNTLHDTEMDIHKPDAFVKNSSESNSVTSKNRTWKFLNFSFFCCNSHQIWFGKKKKKKRHWSLSPTNICVSTQNMQNHNTVAPTMAAKIMKCRQIYVQVGIKMTFFKNVKTAKEIYLNSSLFCESTWLNPVIADRINIL